jgi:hypothetical protein
VLVIEKLKQNTIIRFYVKYEDDYENEDEQDFGLILNTFIGRKKYRFIKNVSIQVSIFQCR